MPEPSPRVAVEWTLPIIPAAFNTLNWGHWARKKREADRWKLAARSISRGPFLQGAAARRMKLTITVHRKGVQDPDNAVASCKYLVDALVRRGWLPDDTTEWLELEVREKKVRKNTRTHIRLETAAE